MSIRQSAPDGSYQAPYGYGSTPAVPGQAPEQPHPPTHGRRRPPGRQRWAVIGMAVIAVLSLVAMAVAVAQIFKADPPPAASVPADHRADHVVSAPLAGRTEATLDIVDSAAVLTLTAADLGDDLYRVSTPGDGALIPKVEDANGAVSVRLVASANNAGSGSVIMQINSKVAWNLKLTGGAGTEVVDLRAAKLTGLDVIGGSSKIEITLPPVTGTMTVNMRSGAGQFLVHAPKNVPVKVRLGIGAGTVTVDGTSKTNVAANTVISPPGWDAAKDKLDINAAGGASVITVDRT